MQRTAALAGILLAGGVITAAAAQGLPGIEDIEQVSEHVYKIAGAGGNSVVFVRSDDVVLVDTKIPGQGEGILAQVRKISDLPVGMVINTHSHPDHIGSNAFFADNPGVTVVAQANTAARMAAGSGPFPPARVDERFTTYREIGEGDERIELHWFGAAHTDGDAFVFFPQDKVLMAGDAYAWHMSPLIDPASGGSMLAAPTTLTAAYYNIPAADTVITGHGGVRSREDFFSFVTFNRALVQIAEQTVQAGGTEDEAMARLNAMPGFAIFMGADRLPGLEYGGTPRSRARINLRVAMAELRGEDAPLIMNLPPAEQ
jgi:glyoxylase-like metal-dependent hydrolase (beta-lactamase superfamily II)